jgi:NAD+ diphosphatase
MIQEISPHCFNNKYLTISTIGENDFVLHFNENMLLLKTNEDNIEIPRKKDIPGISDKPESIFLFTLDNVSCFLISNKLNPEGDHFVYKEINFFRNIKSQEIAWISIVGFHLWNWYTQHKFCGKCGNTTQHKPDERALICTNCHTIFYPKISPAIIVAIVCKNNILLARNTNFPGSWYSLIAGYVDIGESLEEALIREVKEEVGLDVTNIRYYKSQPWPLSGSMMIGFVAEADENQPIKTNNQEIAEAQWFSRGNLPQHSSTISIAGEMIEKFEKDEL